MIWDLPAKKQRWCREWCYRHEISGHNAPRLDRRLLRELSRRDRNLTLVWNPVRRRWSLYRVLRRGATPLGDYLQLEFEIEYRDGSYREPGFWLFDLMNRLSKTHNGSIDPKIATKMYLDDLFERDRREEEARERERTDLRAQMDADLDTYAVRERKSTVFERGLACGQTR